MKAILVLVILSTLTFKSASANFKVKFTAHNFSKMPEGKDLTTLWIDWLDDRLDIKYHVQFPTTGMKIFRHKLGFQFEIRGRNGQELEQLVKSTGHIGLIGRDGEKKTINTKWDYDKRINLNKSGWFYIPELTRDQILDPNGKWYDAKRDTIVFEHVFDYQIEGDNRTYSIEDKEMDIHFNVE